MDINTLKRDGEKIKSNLYKTSNNQILTKKECKVYFPVRYEEQGLAEIGPVVEVIGFFAIVIEDIYYSVNKTPCMMKMVPEEIDQVKIDDEVYNVLTFLENSVFLENTNLVIDSMLLYGAWSEFISKGRIPWFFNYRDISTIFKEAKYYGGKSLALNHVLWELIASIISRDSKNLRNYYRHTIKDIKELETNPPTFIKLNSVMYNATNTTSKLMGGYFDEGMTSALIEPSKKKESVETLLRK